MFFEIYLFSYAHWHKSIVSSQMNCKNIARKENIPDPSVVPLQSSFFLSMSWNGQFSRQFVHTNCAQTISNMQSRLDGTKQSESGDSHQSQGT